MELRWVLTNERAEEDSRMAEGFHMEGRVEGRVHAAEEDSEVLFCRVHTLTS